MKAYFSALAVSDLEQIRDFLVPENVATASRLLDEVDSVCDNLEQFPQLGVSRDDLQASLRMLKVMSHYVVFYRVEEPFVEIVRVVHTARDFDRLFDTRST